VISGGWFDHNDRLHRGRTDSEREIKFNNITPLDIVDLQGKRRLRSGRGQKPGVSVWATRCTDRRLPGRDTGIVWSAAWETASVNRDYL